MPADLRELPHVKQGTSSQLESTSVADEGDQLDHRESRDHSRLTRSSKGPPERWTKRLGSPAALVLAVIVGLGIGIPGTTYLKSKLDLHTRDQITATEKRRTDLDNDISQQRVASERALHLINDAIARTKALIAIMSGPVSANLKGLQYSEVEKNKAIAEYKTARDNLLFQRDEVSLRFQSVFRKDCLLRDEWDKASAQALDYVDCFENAAKDRDVQTKCASDMTSAVQSASVLNERIAEAIETEESHAEEEEIRDRTISPCRNYPPISTPSPR